MDYSSRSSESIGEKENKEKKGARTIARFYDRVIVQVIVN